MSRSTISTFQLFERFPDQEPLESTSKAACGRTDQPARSAIPALA